LALSTQFGKFNRYGIVLHAPGLAAAIGIAPAGASAPIPAIIAAAPAMFDSEVTAQKHCPRDVVVWL
jgi:hypothetical protein